MHTAAVNGVVGEPKRRPAVVVRLCGPDCGHDGFGPWVESIAQHYAPLRVIILCACDESCESLRQLRPSIDAGRWPAGAAHVVSRLIESSDFVVADGPQPGAERTMTVRAVPNTPGEPMAMTRVMRDAIIEGMEHARPSFADVAAEDGRVYVVSGRVPSLHQHVLNAVSQCVPSGIPIRHVQPGVGDTMRESFVVRSSAAPSSPAIEVAYQRLARYLDFDELAELMVS